MDTDEALEAMARAVAEETEALLAALPEALEIQWRPALIPRPDEDTSERSKGERPKDPTGDTVADERRLRVRLAVLGSLRRVREAHAALAESRGDLERSVAAWKGERAV